MHRDPPATMPEEILTVLEAHTTDPKAQTKGAVEIVDTHTIEARAQGSPVIAARRLAA